MSGVDHEGVTTRSVRNCMLTGHPIADCVSRNSEMALLQVQTRGIHDCTKIVHSRSFVKAEILSETASITMINYSP